MSKATAEMQEQATLTAPRKSRPEEESMSEPSFAEFDEEVLFSACDACGAEGLQHAVQYLSAFDTGNRTIPANLVVKCRRCGKVLGQFAPLNIGETAV